MVHERSGQGLGIHLQADGERGLRADPVADATVLLAGDCLLRPLPHGEAHRR
jgi:hypothetical protein